jgi:hypothetical protein
MIDPNLDHVGIVVPELESTLKALSTHLGVEWLPIVEPVLPMHDETHGTRDVKLRIGLTTQYPRLEVIETIPDSPWAIEGSGIVLHHLAYFAGDLSEDSHRVSGPCPIEIAGASAEGLVPTTFTYHVHNGLRFELLDPFLRTGSITQ